MSDEEQTIGDAASGAEEHDLDEADEPGQGAGGEEGAEPEDEDERSPWAE